MSSNNGNTNVNVIPLHLQKLFEDINFIASATKDGKPCFNTREYVDHESFLGIFKRMYYSENRQGAIQTIRDCCIISVEFLELYKDTVYEPLIIKKILNMRQGLVEIANTYSKKHSNISVVNHIKDSIILIDMKLKPEEESKQ